jgi:hypothetical protein
MRPARTSVSLPAAALRWLHAIPALLLVAALAGCAVKLAPDFDRLLLDGLTKANKDTLVFFSSISGGTKPAGYKARAPTYDTLIGTFEALRAQANARPAPNPGVLRNIGIGSSVDLSKIVPTPKALERIIATLNRMKATDQERAMTPGAVKLFKDAYAIAIEQALVYERALER